MALTDLDTIEIVDVDSHVAEPVDLWTSRVAKKWGDAVPTVVWDEGAGEHRWRVGDTLLAAVGEYCSAGWKEPFPSHPPTLEEADPACWDPNERVRKLDAWGVTAQVLYPNIIGFDAHAFLDQLGPELATECVRAYNDFLAEFAGVAPKRFIPMMMLPFWNVDASVKEMARAHQLGHKGVLFAALLQRIGLPNISDPLWTPVLATAEEMGLSINYHVGFSVRTNEALAKGWKMRTKTALQKRTDRQAFVKNVTLGMASNTEAAAETILRGVASRHPRLKFVSVESGFGYWPWVLEQMDWLWQSSGASKEFPDRELPSVIWRQSFYATYWFERGPLVQLEDYADNVMYETDFPHETSLPAVNVPPREHAIRGLEAAGVSIETARKVLYGNAARLYHLD
jgi:predicted TIM-barrel fold metal-dependent hydrolase